MREPIRKEVGIKYKFEIVSLELKSLTYEPQNRRAKCIFNVLEHTHAEYPNRTNRQIELTFFVDMPPIPKDGTKFNWGELPEEFDMTLKNISEALFEKAYNHFYGDKIDDNENS